MGRKHSPPGHVRTHVAHLAARLIAEDGVADIAAAKRKAAVRAGAVTREQLPSNEEVEQALSDYLLLFKREEHTERLTYLRKHALHMMQLLDRFNPRLSGPVLDGHAGRYAHVDLHLFTDSAKEVELFLLNSRLDYRPRTRKVYIGTQQQMVAAYLVTTDEADYDISVFSSTDLRHSIRNSAPGRPLRHAGPADVRAMLTTAVVVSST